MRHVANRPAASSQAATKGPSPSHVVCRYVPTLSVPAGASPMRSNSTVPRSSVRVVGRSGPPIQVTLSDGRCTAPRMIRSGSSGEPSTRAMAEHQ